MLREDYRNLRGWFDKIVSIEMFEAVGLNRYDDYFKAVDRLLAPDGSMMLQTITVDDQWFPHYHGRPDWIDMMVASQAALTLGNGQIPAEIASGMP